MVAGRVGSCFGWSPLDKGYQQVCRSRQIFKNIEVGEPMLKVILRTFEQLLVVPIVPHYFCDQGSLLSKGGQSGARRSMCAPVCAHM